MALGVGDIAAALAAGDFDKFIGEVENDVFDAKGQPYDVNTDTGKRELAKDASAFANGQGGYLLIGLRTKPSLVRYADEVVAIRAFDQQLVDPTQLQNILDSWIYPKIEGVTVQFHPSAAQTQRGIVAIKVPPQRDEVRPFLIVRVLDGTRQVETIFGYAERKGDRNSPLEIQDLQRALRLGLHYERHLVARLDRIEARLAERDTDLVAAIDTDGALKLLEQRIKDALDGGRGGGS